MHFIQFQNIFVGTLNGITLNIVINSSIEVLYSSWINFGSLYFAVLSLVQGSENVAYGPNPALSIFANEVLLDHGHAHLF